MAKSSTSSGPQSADGPPRSRTQSSEEPPGGFDACKRLQAVRKADKDKGMTRMPKPFRLGISTGLLVAACLLAFSACSKGGNQPASSSGSAISVAMIPKGTSHTFWQSIHAGANKAAKELGVEVIWRGPLREDDRDSQVSEVEGFISRGVSGIVLAPLDEAALVGPVDDAMGKKIPVVIFDSGLKGENYVSFVATDNFKGGQLGGERLVEAIGGKGRVVLLRYAEGHDSTT